MSRGVGPLRASRCRMVASDLPLPEGYIPTSEAAVLAKVWGASLYVAQDRDELHPILWRGAMFWDRGELEIWAMRGKREERNRRKWDAARRANTKA